MNKTNWSDVFPAVPSSFHSRIQTTLDELVSDKPERNRTLMKKRRFMIVLAAILACGVITAGAAYYFSWNSKLAEEYHADEQMQAQLAEEGAIADVAQSVSANGLTVTAVQTLGDKNGVYILLEIDVPDDINISGGNLFERSSVNIESTDRINVFSGFMCKDGNTVERSDDDGYYYEINIFNSDQADLNGKTISLDFMNLQADAGKLDMYTILDGSWSLSWALEYTDNTRIYDIKKSYDMNGRTVVVDSIELSPLSMSINVSGDGVNELYDALDVAHCNSLFAPSFIMTDGSSFTSMCCGREGWAEYPDRQTYVTCRCFDNVLDISQVSTVRLDFPTGDPADFITFTLPE